MKSKLIIALLLSASCAFGQGDPNVYNSTVLLFNRGVFPKRTETAIMAIAARNVEKMTGWRFSSAGAYAVRHAKSITPPQALFAERDLVLTGQLPIPMTNNFMVWLLPPISDPQGWYQDDGWGCGDIAVVQSSKDVGKTILVLTRTMINLLFAQGAI